LIDASQGNTINWGKITVPTGFRVTSLRVKVKKDESKCGVNYSLKFNSATTPQDIEFKFRFDPAIETQAGDVIRLKLDSIVSHLRLAADNGSIASLKERVEEKVGMGIKE
jgi:hypothetical protein